MVCIDQDSRYCIVRERQAVENGGWAHEEVVRMACAVAAFQKHSRTIPAPPTC